ncbi:recombinase family protein [Alkalibacterium sp. MB6]|uniref:recombinase family protein n=1 Tax=Alkalibacterium sp. MB6 TaxID=2081965 RepID=UPI00137B0435|nr:recombinase family protein [Alkalibacterium sp. MB6]
MTQNRNAPMNPRVRVIPANMNVPRGEDGEEKKVRVAAYARVSTLEEDQQSSYRLQVSYFEEYINRKPDWELYRVYSDEGVTGTNTRYRTGFNEMIKDAKEGKFDYIITKSISRFARNTLDCLTYVRMLKNLDKPVGIIFDKEGINTLDSQSETILVVIASVMEEESRTISANVSWGVTKRFSQGIPHIPTTYFLGYDEDEEGNLIIDEAQAKTVRRIFRDFLNGKGTPIIAKELTRDKEKTARGNTKWTSDAVYKIIKNEKYCGHALCQKSVTLDPLSHKRVRNKNHKPQYFIRNHHPPIVSEADWNAAQKELDRRRKMLHDPDGNYRSCYSNRAPFSNMLFCGHCGMPVNRRRMTSRKNGKPYKFTVWHCRTASQRVKCDIECNEKYMWEEVIEGAYNQMLLRMTKELDQIKIDGEKAIREVSLTKEENERLEELEEIIDRISDQISDMSMRENVTNDSIYDAALRNLIYEVQIYQQEQEMLMRNKDESIKLTENLELLLGYLKRLDDFETFDAEMFKKIVERGILHKDYGLEFIFKCGVSRKTQGWKRGKKPIESLDITDLTKIDNKQE